MNIIVQLTKFVKFYCIHILLTVFCIIHIAFIKGALRIMLRILKCRGQLLRERELERIWAKTTELKMLIIDGSTIFKGKWIWALQIITFDPLYGFWYVICQFGVVFRGQSICEVKIKILFFLLKSRIWYLFNSQ